MVAVRTGHDQALNIPLAQESLHALAIGVVFGIEADIVKGRTAADEQRIGSNAIITQPLRDLGGKFGCICVQRATREKRGAIGGTTQIRLALDIGDVGDVPRIAGAQCREDVVLEIRPELAIQRLQLGLLLEQ